MIGTYLAGAVPDGRWSGEGVLTSRGSTSDIGGERSRRLSHGVATMPKCSGTANTYTRAGPGTAQSPSPSMGIAGGGMNVTSSSNSSFAEHPRSTAVPAGKT